MNLILIGNFKGDDVNLLQRYKIINDEIKTVYRFHLINIKNDRYTRKFDLSVGDNVSILYIDTLSEIGEGKEYVLHGKVKNVVLLNDLQYKTFDRRELHYQIILDVSEPRGSKLIRLDTYNILDIREYKYDYDLDENTIIIPDDIEEDFRVINKKDNQIISVTTANDPLLNDGVDWGEVK